MFRRSDAKYLNHEFLKLFVVHKIKVDDSMVYRSLVNLLANYPKKSSVSNGSCELILLKNQLDKLPGTKSLWVAPKYHFC